MTTIKGRAFCCTPACPPTALLTPCLPAALLWQKKEQQKASAAALDMVLFKEAKKKSEIKRAAEAACLAKEKDKEPEKRDIHVDLREQKEQDGAPRPRLLPWPLVPWRRSEGESTVPESLSCCARRDGGVGRREAQEGCRAEEARRRRRARQDRHRLQALPRRDRDEEARPQVACRAHRASDQTPGLAGPPSGCPHSAREARLLGSRERA
jgi:hypothetical protein